MLTKLHHLYLHAIPTSLILHICLIFSGEVHLKRFWNGKLIWWWALSFLGAEFSAQLQAWSWVYNVPLIKFQLLLVLLLFCSLCISKVTHYLKKSVFWIYFLFSPKQPWDQVHVHSCCLLVARCFRLLRLIWSHTLFKTAPWSHNLWQAHLVYK